MSEEYGEALSNVWKAEVAKRDARIAELEEENAKQKEHIDLYVQTIPTIPDTVMDALVAAEKNRLKAEAELKQAVDCLVTVTKAGSAEMQRADKAEAEVELLKLQLEETLKVIRPMFNGNPD